VKTWPMLVVPASAESRAETSWALSQPVFDGGICVSAEDSGSWTGSLVLLWMEGCIRAMYDVIGNRRVGTERGRGRRKRGRHKRTSVHHHVHRSPREDGGVARGQDLRDQPGAVLLVHVRGGVARDGHDVVDRVRVPVRWEHRAGAQVEHCH
jgi:hypothetical protein